MAVPMRQIFSTSFSHIILSRCFASRMRGIFTGQITQKDIRKVFIDSEVQSILKRITGFDMNRINAPQLADLQESQMKLLTDDQLKEAQEKAKIEAEEKLVMPPVMDPREEINEILHEDPEVKEAVYDKMVFTDITFGVPDHERIIVVREINGTLRSASWNERERMQQIYFPRDGRKLRMPKMFLHENLQRVLDEERYLYALERACLQFEPNDPDFIRVTKTVYDYILHHKHFDLLRSTRHFGPMAFHYARNKVIDQLLIYFLNQGDLDCAGETVRLLHIMHPDTESAVAAREKNTNDTSVLLDLYCQLEAKEKGPISLLLQSLLQEQAEG